MSNTIIQDTTSAISDSTAVRDKKDLLDKICSVDYLQQHRDAIARHQDGTGNWFLRDPIYQAWTSSSRATLVCPGVPGAGKTIMAALVIEQQRRTVLSAQKPVVFIYYDYKRRDQQTLRHFLETILRQLVDAQSDLPEPVKALYENTPSTADIERTLYETVKHLEGMIIVTDALDECHDDTRQGVLTLVAKLQDHTEVRYMATTRDLHASISHAVFRKQPTLTIKAMRRDLEAYTRSRAQTLRVKIEPNLLEDLVIGVVAAADGMLVKRNFILAGTIHRD
jgi:Cdc6-like AAA superfamily ATPase